jgi:cysteine synthase A
LRLFNEPAGQALLTRRGLPEATVAQLPLLGISSICNLLASIKTARHYELGADDVVLTCFTDSVELYRTRLSELTSERGPYDERQAEIDFERRLLATTTDHLKELTYPERKAVHNLKYFTWVEQQGKTVEELDALWSPGFWRDLQARLPEWDKAIIAFNRDTGALDKLKRVETR